jgi:hypothetical protein
VRSDSHIIPDVLEEPDEDGIVEQELTSKPNQPDVNHIVEPFDIVVTRSRTDSDRVVLSLEAPDEAHL